MAHNNRIRKLRRTIATAEQRIANGHSPDLWWPRKVEAMQALQAAERRQRADREAKRARRSA